MDWGGSTKQPLITFNSISVLVTILLGQKKGKKMKKMLIVKLSYKLWRKFRLMLTLVNGPSVMIDWIPILILALMPMTWRYSAKKCPVLVGFSLMNTRIQNTKDLIYRILTISQRLLLELTIRIIKERQKLVMTTFLSRSFSLAKMKEETFATMRREVMWSVMPLKCWFKG